MASKNKTIKISGVNNLTVVQTLSTLPTTSGVYQFYDLAGNNLYIGKAKNLRNRVRQYFQKSRNIDLRIEALVGKVETIEIITTDSEIDALILEATLIKSKKPRYNILMKDGKTYPYIVITKEDYPRVFVTRNIIRDGSKYFGPFTETFRMRGALKLIRDIFKIRSCNFSIDDEFIRKKKTRVCLDYHIKKCDGPCEGLISQKDYNLMISNVEKLLRGRTNSLKKEMKSKMLVFANEQKFEAAAEIRNQINLLEIYENDQNIVDLELHDRDYFAISIEKNNACGVVLNVREGKLTGRQHFYLSNFQDKSNAELFEVILERFYLNDAEIPNEIILQDEPLNKLIIQNWLKSKSNTEVEISLPKNDKMIELIEMAKKNAAYLLNEFLIHKIKYKDFIPNAVKSVQRDLRLKTAPRKIECFDISHIQGADTVASMVQFVDGKPKKGEYRRFKIETSEENKIDDFASMREVVFRRYNRIKNEELLFPDLIIIDGGKGQLSSAMESLEKLELKIPIISLAKRLEEVFLPNESDPFQIPRTSSSLRIFQQIRDEAHRFAVTYHRLLRNKRTLQTELDLINGVGKKKAKELLETFGSVQGVKFATAEQIEEVVGEKIAERIKEYFSN
ncbi:MAG: excinuclease ABC subunit UvrC [Bacteroidetes bacterium]|nr:excinuclease ABC subunit UvrC [Bacteroidota bacterium]